MDTYQVAAARAARLSGVSGAQILWMDDFTTVTTLQMLIGMIQGNGRTVLVNTGPSPDLLPGMNAFWQKKRGPSAGITVDPDDTLPKILARWSVDPNRVDAVVVTPLQAYALGNLALFPNARICLSRRGWIDFHAPRFRPHPHDVRPMCIPDAVLVPLVTSWWERVCLLGDEDEIFPGIRTFWTGGHHRSSMAVSVDSTDGCVVFSDVMFRYANIERPWPLGINESLEETLTAYERIRREARHPVPLYDAEEVLRRYPGGLIAG